MIVGIGTSFPELASSVAAVLQGETEIVSANVIGSNIANILFVVGLVSFLGGRLVVTKDLIDLDLPLLAISTVLFLGAAQDRIITAPEAIILLVGYGVYFLSMAFHTEEVEGIEGGVAGFFRKRPSRPEALLHKKPEDRPQLAPRDIVLLAVGIAGLAFGAKYLIDSVVMLSTLFHISTGMIAITAIALGTSLPELFVSGRAALSRKAGISLGNILGSNVFNMLAVIGVSGLLRQIHMDDPTFLIGIPTLIATTILFVISGISRRVYIWEGAFYLLLYLLFLGKLFQFI